MMRLFRKLTYGINVYEGISPSLLATMSLSVNIKGRNHNELIDNMVKAGLIQDREEIDAYKSLDRQHFTSLHNPYENRPYAISNRENMTDIFTHSIIVTNLTSHWKNNIRVLDVGTGHGYLSFLISKIL
jgi:protein-L-isoaspartate O-methyltransferase